MTYKKKYQRLLNAVNSSLEANKDMMKHWEDLCRKNPDAACLLEYLQSRGAVTSLQWVINISKSEL